MTDNTDPLTTLPDTMLARDAVALIEKVESASIANHSVRTYLFARLVAEHLDLRDGHDYDDAQLFAACVLHDLGLADGSTPGNRFEVVGADRAAEFLTTHGWPAADVDAVWEAIALHSSAQISERRGPLCLLVREGVTADFGGAIGPGTAPTAVSDADAAVIHRRYPRLSMARSLVEAITAHAALHPSHAPRFTLPGELLRERGNPPALTALERAAAESRWGS